MKNIPIMGKDISWSVIDSEVCRVISFTPLAKLVNNQVIALSPNTPYASLEVECIKLNGSATMWITHKTDFQNLTNAFYQKKGNEEVLIFWSVKQYNNFIFTLLSPIMPKLWVLLCKREAFELMSDNNYKPKLGGEARFLAKAPIREWKPEVMK